MYLITNRELHRRYKSLKFFGKEPNAKGPNELRLVEVVKTEKSWIIKEITDHLTPKAAESLSKEYNLGLDLTQKWHASLKVACKLFDQARKESKSILFFTHGYNNDVEDVLNAAMELERLYGVIVVPFTWPANGGGVVSGTASYLSDKADARVSAGAMNRAVGKIQQYHHMLTAGRKNALQQRASKKHPDNRQQAGVYFTQLMEKDCLVTLNLLCHSMGNYVFKNTFKNSGNATSNLVFDNICLVAADANNKNHAEWVEKIDVRKRVNIVINENDSALRASRLKPGDEQLARLGHYIKKLNSSNATYIDVTEADHVDSEHTYFKGEAVKKNAALKALFHDMFNGRAVEEMLEYRSDNNSYRLT